MDDQRHHPYENLQLNIAGHAHYEYAEVARSYVPMHWHDALELIYILSGELTVETEQRRWAASRWAVHLHQPLRSPRHHQPVRQYCPPAANPDRGIGGLRAGNAFAPVHLGCGDDESDDDGGH